MTYLQRLALVSAVAVMVLGLAVVPRAGAHQITLESCRQHLSGFYGDNDVLAEHDHMLAGWPWWWGGAGGANGATRPGSGHYADHRIVAYFTFSGNSRYPNGLTSQGFCIARDGGIADTNNGYGLPADW